MSQTKSGNQKLNKREKKLKDLIPTLYKYQATDQWLETGKRLLEYYNGRHYKDRKNSNRFTYNAMFSNVQTLIPNLVLNNPYIRVKPTKPTYLRENVFDELEQVNNIESARLMESAINHEYKVIHAIDEIKKALFDPLFWGFGITKTGYSFHTYSGESEYYDQEDTVFKKRINPKDFGFHPIATGVHDAPVLSHRILTTKDALKKNKNYENVASISSSIPEHMKDKLKEIENADKEYVTIWEVHDQENDEILTYGGDSKILMWKREREYDHKGSDFQLLRYAGEPDEFLGIAYLLMSEDEQRGMNEVLTLMINHLHMFPGRVWVEEGMVDDDDIKRIESGGQGAIQIIKALDKVKFQNPLSMGGDYHAVLNILQGLNDRTMSFPDFMRSANPQRKSASESAFIKGDVDIKRQHLGNIVKQFILDGIDNIAYLMQEFYDRDRYVMAEGSIDFKFIKYTKKDIQGEYMFDFDIDTLQASNQTQVQELINALNILAAHPALAPILQTFDSMKLGKEIFKKMGMNIEAFQIKDIEDVTFIDPEKENLIALEPKHPSVAKYGGIIPDPKKNEPHKEHLDSHFKAKDELAMRNQSSEEIDRHILLTGRLLEKEQQAQSPSFAPPGEGQGGNGPGPQPTPSGPMNLPGQAAASRIRPQ